MESNALPLQMNSAKPTSSVTIRLVGVKPEDVRLSQMAELVAAVQHLTAPDLRLLKIRRTSAAYDLVSDLSNQMLVETLLRCHNALTEPAKYLHSSMLMSMDKIARILRKLECSLQVFTPDKRAKWDLNSEDWDDLRQRFVTEDEATIIGELQRVGGATRNHCSVRVPYQKELVYCKLGNAELARSLGPFLYSDVELKGRGEFFVGDWKLMTMNVTEFVQRKPTSFALHYKRMRQLGAAAWDDIDPDNFLQELR